MRATGLLLNSNALIQRVRRHRAMATIYRSVVEDVAAVPQSPATSMADTDRVPIPKASLLPAGSNLPEGRVFTIAKGMGPVSRVDRVPADSDQTRKPVQPQKIQRQEAASSQVPSAPAKAASRPSTIPSPDQAEERPAEDEGFNWISDRQWEDLKSFMEGHQQKLDRYATGQEPAETQLSPEEKAQREAHEQIQAEMTRRQELARSGRLPRAKVEYVSKKGTPVESGSSPAGDITQRSTQETDEVQVEKPAEPQAEVSAPDTISEFTGTPAESPAPVSEPTPKKWPQEKKIDSSPSPDKPVPPPVADQMPGPATESIQQQLDEPTTEQQRLVEAQESELAPPEPSLTERPASAETDELPPSRPLESELDRVAVEPASELQHEVGEISEQTTTKSSTIQRELTGKSPGVEPAVSQPSTEIDRQASSETTLSPAEPPSAGKPSGLGRRLLDAVRSLFGREETEPEPDRPAEELPIESYTEPQASVQLERSSGPADQMIQRQSVEEDTAEPSATVAREETAAPTKALQPQKPLVGDVVTGQDSIQGVSKAIPTQTHRDAQLEIGQDDQEAVREVQGKQVSDDEGFVTETGPSAQEEGIIRQEQITEASAKSTNQDEEEALDKTAGPVPDVMTEVEDAFVPPQSPDRGSERLMKESEDAAAFDDLELADDQAATQAFPLQDAWPVQELRPPKELPPSMTRPVEAPKPRPTAQRKPAGADTFVDEVHQATKDVTPGKPTDSSIELVTPRKPRPSLPPDSKPTADVQRKPPESRQRESIEPVPSKETTPKPPEKKPYLVPTDVGDLPSDLWQMLGEKPPVPQEKVPTSRARIDPTTTTGAVQLLPDTNGAPALVAELLSPLVTREFPAPQVQRAVTIEELDTAIPERQSEEAETAREPEIDLDQLAREVFPEIKRRLKVEWERGRGRF